MGITEIPKSATMLGVLVHDGTPQNRIFDSNASADGINEKWIALRDIFAARGVALVAESNIGARAPDFEIHLNARTSRLTTRTFAILSECGLVHPPNVDRKILQQYLGVFTWNDELVEAGIATKIQLAHPLQTWPVDGFKERNVLVVLIAANKALPVLSRQDLYAERVRTIRWFERHAPDDFVLYGHGWDKSPRLPTRLGGLIHRLEGYLPWRPQWFPSWRGPVACKRDVLTKARFSIVYENVRGLRGYITEKIFDAFAAGNVPVYWGADDIAEYVPSECFIDRRKFSSHAELYAYLRDMSEGEYRRYQQAIRDFVTSDAARAFAPETFAEAIVKQVLKALEQPR